MPQTETATTVQATIEGNELVVRVPLENPMKPSATGKSITVASSRGNQKTEAVVNGKNVIIGLNAYIPAK